MSRKGLNIYHRKDGRWEGRYRSGYNADGRVKLHSVYGKSYSDVRKKLLVFENKLPKSACFLTVQKLSEEWLKIKQLRVKVSTYENYAFKLKKYLIPRFGNVSVNYG